MLIIEECCLYSLFDDSLIKFKLKASMITFNALKFFIYFIWLNPSTKLSNLSFYIVIIMQMSKKQLADPQ